MNLAILKLTDLEAAKACQEQCQTFKELFGDEVNVTPALARRVAGKFNWDWAVQNLLSPAGLAEYKRISAPARAEYKRTTAPALAEYERISGSAWAEYKRTTAPARAEYQRINASAWAKAWNKDHRLTRGRS